MESVSVTQDEKDFIEFLVDFIVTTNPGDLLSNLDKVSQHMQKEYEPKHPLNIYRKSFGSLNNAIAK